MTRGAAAAPIRVRTCHGLPGAWETLLASCPDHGAGQDGRWLELAARHHPAADLRVLLAEQDGSVVGGLAAVVRRRHGLDHLESSIDGLPGGPLVPTDLPPAVRCAAFAALCGAYADLAGGRTALVIQTLDRPDALALAADLADPRWTASAFAASVVDCREGLEHVERRLWTNNRRNERNRGLKRGCVLATEHDPDVVREWYPLYLASAAAWAQAPLPAALVAALLREAPDRFLLTTCRRDGQLVGGHLCVRTAGGLLAWQSGVQAAALREVFVATLLYWQDLVTACSEGLEAVDYGGSVGRDTLADFKRRCGGRPQPRLMLMASSRLGRTVRRAGQALRRLRGRTP